MEKIKNKKKKRKKQKKKKKRNHLQTIWVSNYLCSFHQVNRVISKEIIHTEHQLLPEGRDLEGTNSTCTT